MEEQRFNKNTNWKVKCERMSTARRDKATDGDNPVIFNTDTNQYEGWNGTEWIALAGGGSGPGNVTASNGLTKDGEDIKLGGTLTEQTQIDLGNLEFKLQGTENSIEIRPQTTFLITNTPTFQTYFAMGSSLPLGGNGVTFGSTNFNTGANYQLNIGGEDPFFDGLTYFSRRDGVGSSSFGLGATCYMGFSDGGDSIGFDFSARSDGFKINDTIFNKGLVGTQDFSDNYDDFTYVQKKYVDDAIAQGGGSTTASNGLTKVGDDVQLGGDVTSKVNINLAGPLADILLGRKGNNFNVTNNSIFTVNEDTESSRGVRIDDEEIVLSSTDLTNNNDCRIILNKDGAEDGVNIVSNNSVENTLTLFRIANEVSLSYFNNAVGGGYASITFGADSEGIEIRDTKNQKGLVGGQDYSANYDDFTYVQKKYVDDSKGYKEIVINLSPNIDSEPPFIQVIRNDFGVTASIIKSSDGIYEIEFSGAVFEDEGKEGIFISGNEAVSLTAFPEDFNKLRLVSRGFSPPTLVNFSNGGQSLLEIRVYN